MSVFIPSTIKTGGKGYVRNYKGNAHYEIMKFKIKMELLKEYYGEDSKFYISSLCTIFRKDVECLGGKTEYTILYNAILINEYILDEIRINDFDHFISSIITRFHILDPLVKSLFFLLDKKNKEDYALEDIQNDIVEFIRSNKLKLVMIKYKPDKTTYEKKFNQYIKKISTSDIDNNAEVDHAAHIIQKNIKEFIHLLDIVSQYIIDLEEFYIELTDKIYKYSKK